MIHGPEYYLDSDAGAARVMAHARLLLKLSRRFEAIAPAAFRHATRVANYKSGIVVIHAENGAVAAKIRQMSRRLCDELSRGGTQCSDIEVKVQPRQSAFQSMPSASKGLSAQARASLGTAASALPEGPLRRALDQLVRRALEKEAIGNAENGE